MSASEPTPRDEITSLLLAWSEGDEDAAERLIPLVHGRLMKIAASFLNQERPEHTLETAALVNEAYLDLVDQKRARWKDRAHFFAIAGRLMRRILVDHARSKAALKRGGGWDRVSEETLGELEAERRRQELLRLDDALGALGQENAELARIVEMRFFGGLNVEEMTTVTGQSATTLNRRWRLARAWLRREMEETAPAT